MLNSYFTDQVRPVVLNRGDMSLNLGATQNLHHGKIKAWIKDTLKY